MIVSNAEADFGQQCRRKGAVIVESGAEGILNARSFKSALRGTATLGAEYRSLKNIHLLVAVATAEVVFISDLPIDLGIVSIGSLAEWQNGKIVVGGRGKV